MISINNLTYHLGGRTLFEEASLHIKPKDKIGLVGLNGTGKSTLLKLINGELTPDDGSISKSKECTIGFLNQDLLSYQTEDSILNVAMQAFDKALQVQRKIDQVLHNMETNYEDKLVDRLSHLQEEFEALDGYTIKSRAEEVLEGIGFSTQDLERPLQEFSGGWRMRVMLAKLLLEKPSLLMLDEPTNHLDLPSIQWVENYLKNYEGGIIVVSHDQQFLDNIANTIVEVANQTLTAYSGNYTFYQKEKTERQEIQQNAFENQQQKIKQTERFIERFRSKATKARQVQSRVKSLERMDMVNEVVDNNSLVNFKFNFKQQSGRFVSTLKEVSKAFGELQILKNTNAIIERGEKIALIGANGKGKSTLLRIIAGQDQDILGESEIGYNVKMAFYAQHQLEALSVENEILEELKQAGSEKTEQELRGILGCFLFSEDEIFKKIKILSGGEKSRVALAKMLISEANFLLLDEPTNHLDMQSVNILIQAIQQYQGSSLIVSHDRHFIKKVATKIWYIEDHEIKEYPGTYEEYEYWASKNLNKTEKQDSSKEKKKGKKQTKAVQNNNSSNFKNQLKKLQNELHSLEDEIHKLENQIKEIETELSKPEVYGDVEKLMTFNQKYDGAKSSLEQKQNTWEDTVLAIEEIEEQFK